MDTSILLVSVTSLATHAGIIDDGQATLPDGVRSRLLYAQLGILQQKPRSEQAKIHNELAATHLPTLVEKYRASEGVLNPAATLLNVVTYTPYFIRFARTPTGQGLAAIQTKRTALAASEIGNMTADQVGEIGQFLSTLLVLQGIADVDAEDKAILVPKLKQWERAFSGRLAADTSDRCLALLNDDPHIRPMMQSVKTMLENCIQKCGVASCPRVLQTSGAELMQCARCKSAVYCGTAHQKQAWVVHKTSCFAPSF